MRPYYSDEAVTLYCGDCREVLPSLQADVVVADPPYGMLKAEWDMEIVPVESWLPLAMNVGPVAVFCGVQGIYDYPRPDWVGAWVRVASTQRNGRLRGFNNWEPILFFGLTALSNDVISVSNQREIDGHPTPKPLRLLSALLSRMPDGVVLDPFAGSGTTLVAAKKYGRKAIGIELDEKYCEIAARRLSQGSLAEMFQ